MTRTRSRSLRRRTPTRTSRPRVRQATPWLLAAALLTLGWALWPAPPAPGQRMTGGGAYWGVDSVAPLGSRLASVQQAYEATPSFWGRYLSDCTGACGSNLTRAEARQDLADGIRLVLVAADREGRHDEGYRNGYADGQAAVAAARALGVPGGVAVFKDLENTSPVDALFVLGWFRAVAAGGYSPGYYLNAEPGEDGAFAYCRAVALDGRVASSYLWASESEPDWASSTPPGRAPAYASGPYPAVFPVCPGRRILWQYSEADNAGVDEDEAVTLQPFWR